MRLWTNLKNYPIYFLELAKKKKKISNLSVYMSLGENGNSQTKRRVLATRPMLHFDHNIKPYNSSGGTVTILWVVKWKNIFFFATPKRASEITQHSI